MVDTYPTHLCRASYMLRVVFNSIKNTYDELYLVYFDYLIVAAGHEELSVPRDVDSVDSTLLACFQLKHTNCDFRKANAISLYHPCRQSDS